ncbi:MAG: HDOD domain-containing protein [Gammaproteobacteria bacterium]|nr:HDOD domain-containing protein [Gammaproteobacteria bacterium]
MDEWVQEMSEAELPVLGRTVSQLASVNEYLSSHAAELVRTILHDPNMTAKVLRLSNSVVYNQGRRPINTVSRAIVVLGYEAIRSICLATFVLEKAAAGPMQDMLMQEVARSFHAAVQAKSLAELRGDVNAEELFIGTLLFHLGEVAFWCFGGELAEQLAGAIEAGTPAAEAQRDIVGFRFTALTLGLTKEWGISPVLQEALMNRDLPDSRSRSIRLSHRLAQAIEEGWGSKEAEAAMAAASQYTGVAVSELRQSVMNSAVAAQDTLKEFGLKGAERLVPTPPGLPGAEAEELEQDAEPAGHQDMALQLNILRELTTMVNGKADFNLVLQHVLEGLHRGVGFERVLFALANPQRTAISTKYAVQQKPGDLDKLFSFPLGDPQIEPLMQSFQSHEVYWASKGTRPQLAGLLKKRLKVGDFVLSSLWANNKLIGAFYVDCGVSQRAIAQEDVDAFQMFVSQANMSLQMLSARRGV